MGKNQKSISQRLKSKKTYQGQQKVLSEWCENWHKDQMTTINHIFDAVRENRYGDANMYITHLHAMTDKRFTALGNIINIVSDPDRELEDHKDAVSLTLGEGDLDTPSETVLLNAEDGTFDNENETQKEESVKQYTLDRKPNIDIREFKEIDVDEIIKGYNAGMGVKELADLNEIGWQKITKILVTANVYTSETYDKVKNLGEAGKSDWEIMDLLDLKPQMLNVYTPYKKGIYKLKNPTKNAMNIRKCRKKSED